MGRSIFIIAEIKDSHTGRWNIVNDDLFSLDEIDSEILQNQKGRYPFKYERSVFWFLESLSPDPKGLPDDSNYLNSISSAAHPFDPKETVKEHLLDAGDLHSFSFLNLRELLEFNFDNAYVDEIEIVDERITIQNNPRIEKEEFTSYRDHLGKMFFVNLSELSQLGHPDAVRIIFWVGES